MGIGQVRLPATSCRKGSIRFLKLLSRVAPVPWNAFEFQGWFLRPGGMIDIRELPEPAILLEGAGNVRVGPRARDWKASYLLWRFDRERGEWEEVARALGSSTEWTLDLAPIARRLLSPVEVVPNVDEIAERLRKMIDAEFEPLEAKQRAKLASVLHDQFATHYTAAFDWWAVA